MATKSRAYPYPVLRNWIDDYESSKFEFEKLEIRDEPEGIVLEYALALNNPYLNEQVIDGAATLALEITCAEVLHRSWIEIPTFKGTVVFEKLGLLGNVTVEGFVISTRNRPDFQPTPISAEFGSSFFEVAQGDPLAITEEYSIGLSLDLKGSSDSLVVRRSNDIEEMEYLVDLDGAAIILITGAKAHSYYETMKADSSTQPHIFQSIYKDAILFAILEISRNTDSLERRWAKGLSNKLHDLGISIPNGLSAEDANKIALRLVGKDGFGKVSQNAK